jgi:hypothetical protein
MKQLNVVGVTKVRREDQRQLFAATPRRHIQVVNADAPGLIGSVSHPRKSIVLVVGRFESGTGVSPVKSRARRGCQLKLTHYYPPVTL